ncbi:MAG TPA: pyrroloquinoline quinone-dependent dehydrogenase [Vicinamibacterales bacterium]|nr:pyrroloquinoline quinone-dependent dehydrogenase [Vicinamibacterales bacterium]
MRRSLLVLISALAMLSAGVRGQTNNGSNQWPAYAGDAASTHYSTLRQINRANVSTLAIAWTWEPREAALKEFGTQPGTFQNTPLMIDDVLYVSTPYNRVVALDPKSGREIWRYDPEPFKEGQPPNGTGFVHRGVAAWRDEAGNLRIFMNSRYRLISLDGRSGQPVAAFGNKGIVDLTKGLSWEVNPRHYTNTSPPVVYKNLVILGNGVGDRLTYRNDPPGDIRAFDAHTGKIVWTFRPLPQPGEFGHDTWGGDAWRFTGHTNVWAPMSLDDTRGLLYLPLSTPSNDYYGARRPGANLFAESLVCLDAATGLRKWHFQIVHHGLWDYDLASPPTLAPIAVGGKRIDAVVQLTKQGFAFVFDRVTGEPVWPIEERPVPKSDVSGEQSWPTQPFPTKPPTLSEQGVTLDDAFDLTPALRDAARAELSKYRLGPLYTPPSLHGTVMRPGVIGGANWGGGAYDPESGFLFVKTTSNNAAILKLAAPDKSPANPRADEVDADLINRAPNATFMNGLPLLKPPYGHLTAIDLNRGEIAWRVPIGDTPSLRSHPALKDVALPNKLGAAGAPGAIVTAGGLVFVGGGDVALNAVDAMTGETLWRFPFDTRTTATPMTYSSAGKQYVAIAIGQAETAKLVAFTLP